MQGPPPRTRGPGIGLAALLAGPALALAACCWVWEADPVLLGRILGRWDGLAARSWTILLFGVVPAAAAVLLLYPPAWPLVRLQAEKMRARFAFDRKAARDLLQRLEDFISARDLQSLGQLYLDAGQPRLALGPLTRARELEPDRPRLLYLAGRCLGELGRPAEGLAAVDAALGGDPDIAFGEAWLLAAELALGLGDPGRALGYAAEHERRFGVSIRGSYLVACAAHRCGDTAARKAALDRVLALPPGRGKRYTAAEALARARARVAKHTGGRP